MFLDKEAGFFVSIIVSCLADFLVTLPGTHARLLAVTWGKPVSGCFFRSLAGLAFLLGFFGLLSVVFCQLTGFASFFGHPSTFGWFVVLLRWVWSVLERA